MNAEYIIQSTRAAIIASIQLETCMPPIDVVRLNQFMACSHRPPRFSARAVLRHIQERQLLLQHRHILQVAHTRQHTNGSAALRTISPFASARFVGKSTDRPYLPSRWQMPTDLTLVPLWRSLAFRKYHSACGAVVSAQLWKSVNARNGSGEAHRLAARKTDMVRVAVH
jgi:hypothetical protein